MKRILMVVAMMATQAACLGNPSLIKDSPGDYLQANAPGMVWAVLTDGGQVIIQGPRVIADTIFGWAEGEEFVVPVEDVKEMRVRRISIWRSSIMPALAVGLGVSAIVLVTAAKVDDERDRSQECEDTSGMCADEPGM